MKFRFHAQAIEYIDVSARCKTPASSLSVPRSEAHVKPARHIWLSIAAMVAGCARTRGLQPAATLRPADTLATEGVSAEIVDVATLRPLDTDSLLESVAKTGRCVIVHEAPLTGGFGAEIAARIAERGLVSLLAPIERVAGWDTVMPLPRLEQHYLPSEARILAAVRRVLAYQ